jgi:hypothetical protein
MDWNGTGGWLDQASWESGSTYAETEPPAASGVRANTYDSNRAHAWAFNSTGPSSYTISVSGIFNDGDTIKVYPAEAGTFPTGAAYETVIVSGGNVVLDAAGWSVATPIGSSFTPTTVAPRFAAWILYRTAQAGTGGGGTGGQAKIGGQAKTQ